MPQEVEGFAEHYQLAFLVREFTADIVHLDEIHAPFPVELEQAVVVFPGALLLGVHAVHVSIPLAYAGSLGDLTGGSGSPLDRGIAVNRLARDSAHDMNAELQSQ